MAYSAYPLCRQNGYRPISDEPDLRSAGFQVVTIATLLRTPSRSLPATSALTYGANRNVVSSPVSPAAK